MYKIIPPPSIVYKIIRSILLFTRNDLKLVIILFFFMIDNCQERYLSISHNTYSHNIFISLFHNLSQNDTKHQKKFYIEKRDLLIFKIVDKKMFYVDTLHGIITFKLVKLFLYKHSYAQTI